MGRHVIEGDTAGGDLTGTYPNPTVAISSALDQLPSYATLGDATGAGLVSGDYFFLTATLGLTTVKLLTKIP